MKEIGQIEITVKDLSTGKSRPFLMTLSRDEDGDYIWYGADSTEERRLGEWLGIIEKNISQKE